MDCQQLTRQRIYNIYLYSFDEKGRVRLLYERHDVQIYILLFYIIVVTDEEFALTVYHHDEYNGCRSRQQTNYYYTYYAYYMSLQYCHNYLCYVINKLTKIVFLDEKETRVHT